MRALLARQLPLGLFRICRCGGRPDGRLGPGGVPHGVRAEDTGNVQGTVYWNGAPVAGLRAKQVQVFVESSTWRLGRFGTCEWRDGLLQPSPAFPWAAIRRLYGTEIRR